MLTSHVICGQLAYALISFEKARIKKAGLDWFGSVGPLSAGLLWVSLSARPAAVSGFGVWMLPLQPQKPWALDLPQCSHPFAPRSES